VRWIHFLWKQVKLSLWRPIALWDVEAPTSSRQSAHRWRWGCQPYAPAALYLQEDSWYSFLLEAESTPGPQCGWMGPERSRVRFPMWSLDSSVDLILPAELRSCQDDRYTFELVTKKKACSACKSGLMNEFRSATLPKFNLFCQPVPRSSVTFFSLIT
jgi:hypothetical protein